MSEAPPSTRHGDVLLTVWIIVGATVLCVLCLGDALRLPRLALAVVGALAAGYGEAVARALRPHLRFTETAVAVVIAFLLLPHVARFGAEAFDRDAIVTMVVGTPLGLGAAWQMRRWKAGAGNFPEISAGIFVIAAAVALAVVGLLSVRIEPSRHMLEAGFLVAAIAAGVSFGGTVPGAKPGHLIIGALIVLLAPRVFQTGSLKYVPLYDVLVWTGALGAGGTLGVLVGRRLRERAINRVAPASNLPAARVHDDPG